MRLILWFWQAEGQMAIQQVTDDYFKVIMVQAAALTNAQQDAMASILEQEPLTHNGSNIQCWGEEQRQLQFSGHTPSCSNKLMVDVPNNKLVDSTTR